jgi:hypothetical protein
MANFQYSVENLSDIAVKHVNGTTGNMDSDYPFENILDLANPRVVSRTTNLGTTRWGFDIGTPVNVGAFSIEGTNLNDIIIKAGTNPDGVTYSFSTVYSFSAGVDPADNRKHFIFSGHNAIQYIQIAPNTAISGSYYEIGAFGIWGTLTTLTTNFSKPFEITAQGPETDDDIGKPIRLQFNCNSKRLSLSQHSALANVPRNQVMLLYENESDTRKAYHVRRTGNVRFSRTQDNVTTVSGLYLSQVA